MRYILLALLLLALPAQAKEDVYTSAKESFRLVTVAKDLDFPWCVAFIPEGYLVTERDGKLFFIEPTGKKNEIRGVPPVAAEGQGGLFDIALAPDYATSKKVYFSYAGPKKGANSTELAAATLDLEKRQLKDVKTIFVSEYKYDGKAHFGGKILFMPDGTLFLTLGERSSLPQEAQNLGNHLGKIVHLNADGTPVKTNPFIKNKNAKPEIYSYGHRNVQGIALEPRTGRVWEHEHGPQGGDEVNILKPGANFGWPKITYGIGYSNEVISEYTHLPGMEQPVIYWKPSIAPSGMTFYSGKQFPRWKGDLFVGALKGQHLRRLDVSGKRITAQEKLLENMNERIRDVREGPDGYIYILTDKGEGRLLRLEPVKNETKN